MNDDTQTVGMNLSDKEFVSQLPKVTDEDMKSTFEVLQSAEQLLFGHTYENNTQNKVEIDDSIPTDEQIVMIESFYTNLIEEIKAEYDEKLLDLQSKVSDNVTPKVTENDVNYLVMMMRRISRRLKDGEIQKASDDLDYTIEEYEHN